MTARTAASVPHVESLLRNVQRESRQFQLMVLRELGIRQPKLSAPVDLYPRSRVDLLEVYARPARDAAKVIERGGSQQEAFKAFERRLTGIIDADVMIAERDERDRIYDQLEAEGLTDYTVSDEDEPLHDDTNPSDIEDREAFEKWLDEWEATEGEDPEVRPVDTDEGEKIIGFRRVVRPELSMHGPCGLCVVAASNWYTRKNLKAMHNLCKCTVLPVTKTQDPGLKWNAEDFRRNLDEIYGAAGGTGMKGLKRVRVSVREHGELGPILSYSAKRGWEPVKGYRPYTPPNVRVQRDRLDQRVRDLEITLQNLRSRLGGDGDQGGIEHSIWEVEQAIRDATSRLAA